MQAPPFLLLNQPRIPWFGYETAALFRKQLLPVYKKLSCFAKLMKNLFSKFNLGNGWQAAFTQVRPAFGPRFPTFANSYPPIERTFDIMNMN